MKKQHIDQILENLSEKEKNVLHEAVEKLYFEDSSDYKTALWKIVVLLVGNDVGEETISPKQWLHALDPALAEDAADEINERSVKRVDQLRSILDSMIEQLEHYIKESLTTSRGVDHNLRAISRWQTEINEQKIEWALHDQLQQEVNRSLASAVADSNNLKRISLLQVELNQMKAGTLSRKRIQELVRYKKTQD